MFTNSTRLANVFMVMAALALCVSACTEAKVVDTAALPSYDSAPADGSLLALAHTPNPAY
jgi:hypothetical protein